MVVLMYIKGNFDEMWASNVVWWGNHFLSYFSSAIFPQGQFSPKTGAVILLLLVRGLFHLLPIRKLMPTCGHMGSKTEHHFCLNDRKAIWLKSRCITQSWLWWDFIMTSFHHMKGGMKGKVMSCALCPFATAYKCRRKKLLPCWSPVDHGGSVAKSVKQCLQSLTSDLLALRQ